MTGLSEFTNEDLTDELRIRGQIKEGEGYDEMSSM